MEKTLIVLLGPTGVGKSDLSIRLAQYFHTEIISSDSRQVYRELSIGTAVPPLTDQQKVKHHLIHSHSIHEYYSASHFEDDVLKILQQLFKEKNIAIMLAHIGTLSANAAFKATASLHDAVAIFVRDFERPANPAGAIATRSAIAQDLLV